MRVPESGTKATGVSTVVVLPVGGVVRNGVVSVAAQDRGMNEECGSVCNW